MRRLLSIVTVALAVALLAPAWAQAAAAPSSGPSLQVASACLIAGGSGRQLWSENGSEERAIASTTKIMTALITLQHVTNLNEVFTQMDWTPAADDSQIGLVPGERMSVRDLLYALLIPSADDAAMDLAYNVGGHSVGAFIAMMNAEAKKLGLMHTHYATPSGLDTPGNYSSACDLDKLANYVMLHYPFFRQVVGMTQATLTTGRYVRHIHTTDYLLYDVPWISGIKTGGTGEAGNVLVSEGRRDGMTLIGSVLGAATITARDDNALALLDWGFAEFKAVTPVRRRELVVRAPVKDSSIGAPVVALAAYKTVVRRGDRVQVVHSLRSTQLVGPLARGTLVGQAVVLVNGKRFASVPLVLAQALPAIPWLKLHRSFVVIVGSLLLIVLVTVPVGAIMSRRRRAQIATRRRAHSG